MTNPRLTLSKSLKRDDDGFEVQGVAYYTFVINAEVEGSDGPQTVTFHTASKFDTVYNIELIEKQLRSILSIPDNDEIK
jgi:hypothetical protein